MRVTVILFWILICAAPAAATTLDEVRARGELRCHVTAAAAIAYRNDHAAEPDFFFLDFCRALAAATLDDPDALDLVNIGGSVPAMIAALVDGQFDILAGNVTWTAGREALGVTFPAIYLYDGQTFVARESDPRRRFEDFRGAKVCVWAGSTSEANLIDISARNQLGLIAHEVSSATSHLSEMLNGRCDLATDDLLSLRHAFSRGALDPRAFRILPDIVSREPLAPVVRADDIAWARLVRWLVHALVMAESHNYAQADAAARRVPDARELRRLLGFEGDHARQIGPNAEWARRAIAAIGHYGEWYDRWLGDDSPNPIARRQNALWRDRGLLYAPPFR